LQQYLIHPVDARRRFPYGQQEKARPTPIGGLSTCAFKTWASIHIRHFRAAVLSQDDADHPPAAAATLM
jgi:hypothetical protein